MSRPSFSTTLSFSNEQNRFEKWNNFGYANTGYVIGIECPVEESPRTRKRGRNLNRKVPPCGMHLKRFLCRQKRLAN